MKNLGKILSFACILPHSKTNYFEKVGKTWGFAGQQNHRKILYLGHGQNDLFYNVILPLWKMKGFSNGKITP